MSTVVHTTLGMIAAAYWHKHPVADCELNDTSAIEKAALQASETRCEHWQQEHCLYL
jgi:hypothetical protein